MPHNDDDQNQHATYDYLWVIDGEFEQDEYAFIPYWKIFTI